MGSEKKIIFSGQDGGASQTAKRIYSGILEAAAKQTASLKEQNNLIAAQIKLLEKKKALDDADSRQGVGSMFAKAERMASGAGQQSAMSAARKAEFSLSQKSIEGAEIISILKAIHAEEKKNNTVAEKTEKQSQKKLISSEEQFQAMRSLARQEVRENREGVKKKIAAAEKNDYEGLDLRSAEKLMFQKQLVGEKGGTDGVFGQVFAGTLAAGIVQQVAASLGKIVGTQSGEQAVNSLLGGVPIVGGVLGGASDRTFNEQYAIQTKTLGLRALTGSTLSAKSNTALGFSNVEGLDIQKSLIGAAGSRSGNNSTENAMMLSKGFGLPIEVITQIVKDLRITRSSADIVQIASDVIKANPELRKDQTKFAEILQQTSQLTNEIASRSEGGDMRFNTGMVGALRSVGGNLSTPLGGQLISQINNSLSNPGNDFQKSMNFGALSNLHSGASYWQLREEQEKGLGSKGLLGERLRGLQRMGGSGENLTGLISTSFFGGQNVGTSRKIAEAYNKNPNAFDKFTGSTAAEAEAFLSKGNKRAGENTAPKDREKAEMDNAFAIGAAAGVMDVAAKTFKAAVDKFESALGISGFSASANHKIATAIGLDENRSLLDNVLHPH